VDPKTWKPSDPRDAIARGKSIEAAVENGFAKGLYAFSAIAFNASHTTAALSYSFVCGMLCGNGGVVVFNKTNRGWVKSDENCGIWISALPGGGHNNSFKPNLRSSKGVT